MLALYTNKGARITRSLWERKRLSWLHFTDEETEVREVKQVTQQNDDQTAEAWYLRSTGPPLPGPQLHPLTPALSFPFATILPYWHDFYSHNLSSIQIFAYADSILLPSCSFPSPPQPSLWNECLSVKRKRERERRFWFQVSRLIWKWGMHGGVPLSPLPPGDSVPPSTPAAFGALVA